MMRLAAWVAKGSGVSTGRCRRTKERGHVLKRAPQAAPLVASVLLALALLAGTASAVPVPEAGRLPGPGITFDERSPTRLVLRAPGYQLTLRKHDGAILDLVDRRAGTRSSVARTAASGARFQAGSTDYVGGCTFSPAAQQRFSYAWDRATIDADAELPRRGRSAASAPSSPCVPGDSSFDLRATIENHSAGRRQERAPSRRPRSATWTRSRPATLPNYLPGVRLRPPSSGGSEPASSRIRRASDSPTTSRSTSDGGHLALRLGRARPSRSGRPRLPPHEPPGACWGPAYCVVHAFQTWIRRGESWTSPVVRINVGSPSRRRSPPTGATPASTGTPRSRRSSAAPADARPRAARQGRPAEAPALRRLGARPAAAAAPLAAAPRGLSAGRARRQRPGLPAAGPALGLDRRLAREVVEAHALGHLVMPYLNVTLVGRALADPAGLTPEAARSVAAHDADGDADRREVQRPHRPCHLAVLAARARPRCQAAGRVARRGSRGLPLLRPARCTELAHDFNPAAPDRSRTTTGGSTLISRSATAA